MIWSLRCRRLPMRFAGLASVSTSAVETIGRSVSVPVATAKFVSGDVTNGRVMQFVVVPEPGAVMLAAMGIAIVIAGRRNRRL